MTIKNLNGNGEFKQFHCAFETKDLHEDDEDAIGRFEGFASTFGNEDRMGDIIERGAFTETIREFQGADRPIRMLFQHDFLELIGGFPPQQIFENDRGLFVKGETNLDTQRGREVFSLMKQGVLTDMSIGFFIRDFRIEDNTRIITKAELIEISVVGEPANREARITSVKAVVPFQDLPLAPADHPWDADAAIACVRQFTGSEEEPSSTYKNAFLQHDQENADGFGFGAYRLPIATVIKGQLMAVPRAIFAAAAALQGARGGVSIRSAGRPELIANIAQYYEKMGRESPFEKGFGADELRVQSRGDLVAFMRSGPQLSKSGAECVAAGIMGGSGKQAAEKEADGLRCVNDILKTLKEVH